MLDGYFEGRVIFLSTQVIIIIYPSSPPPVAQPCSQMPKGRKTLGEEKKNPSFPFILLKTFLTDITF